MVGRTFGQSADALSEEDRQALDQLAVNEQAVRERWADWLAGVERELMGVR